jgi:protein TonB
MWGVAASMLLHAAVLFLLPGMREGGKPAATPQVLSATLSTRAAAPPPLPAQEERPVARKPEPRPEPKKPEAPRPVLSTPTPSPAAPQVAPPPQVAAPPSPPPAAPVAPPAPVAAPKPEPPQAPPVAAAPSASTAPSGPEADLVAKYQIQLQSVMRRFSRGSYPTVARANGWEGKVGVRLTINAKGGIEDSKVVITSRHGVLDDAAIALIRKSAFEAWMKSPPAIRGKVFVAEVVTEFKLTDP